MRRYRRSARPPRFCKILQVLGSFGERRRAERLGREADECFRCARIPEIRCATAEGREVAGHDLMAKAAAIEARSRAIREKTRMSLTQEYSRPGLTLGPARRLKRLCMCTMKAVANNGVAKLTSGIDTNSAMTMPPIKTLAA